MQWVIGSDHAGFHLKTALKAYLEKKGFSVHDVGCNSANKPSDYPDISDKACEYLLNKKSEMAILVCGTGIGVSIRANRYPHIRAALLHNEFTAISAKKHNNANVICFGERVIDEATAIQCLQLFVDTKFEGGRHQNRIEKLDSSLLKTK